MSKAPWLKRVLAGESDSSEQSRSHSDELRLKTAEVNELAEDLNQTRKELETRHLQLRKFKQLEESLNSAVAVATAKAERLQRANQDAELKLKKSLSAARQFERSRKESTGRIAKLHRERSEQNARFNVVESKLKALTESHTTLEAQLGSLTRKEKAVGQDLLKSREQIQAASKELAQVKKKAAEDLEQEVTKVRRENHDKLRASRALHGQLTERYDALSAKLSESVIVEESIRQGAKGLVRLAACATDQLLGDRAHLVVEISAHELGSELAPCSSTTSRHLSGVEGVEQHLQVLGIAESFTRTDSGFRLGLVDELISAGGVAHWVMAYGLTCLNSSAPVALRIDSVDAKSDGTIEAVCSPR